MPDEPIYPTLAALLQYAVPDRLFVDVGAHHGLFSIAFHDAGMRVLAIEPFPGNVEQFHIKTSGMCIPVIQAAMGESDARLPLYNGGPSTVHSLIPGMAQQMIPGLQPPDLPPPEIVNVFRWSTLCRECRISEVEILKLDAKWNNLAVLKSLVEHGPFPRVICTEVRKADRDAIFELLEAAQYEFRESIGLDAEREIHDAIFERDIE